MHKIAKVAAVAGVAPSTVRLWENHGLLSPDRTQSGHRFYSDEGLDRARQVATLRGQGLKLDEIRTALRGEDEAGTVGSDGLHADASMSPGARIRRLRLDRGESITEVAEDLGVSPSLISTYERTSAGVSFTFMKRIADRFGVTVTDLTFPDVEDTSEVLRRASLGPRASLFPGVEVRLLGTGRQMMDAKEWIISPGAASEGTYQHEGEELVYVLEGRFEITVEGRGTVLLEAGDSIYFESRRRHSWINRDIAVCKVLWVNTGSF